jgi:predicted Rossmann-fold nucleotide-binding protein
MEIMIERSDAFIVFPGGAGTVQEALALIIYKHQGHTDMMGKPIILYNRQDETGFWDPLCKLLKPWVAPDDLVVINNFTELVPSTLKAMSRLKPARAA